MTSRSRPNRHEKSWPAETVALAQLARRRLCDALHSLRPAHIEPKDAERYERMFADAEYVVDHTEAYKLLPTAQEQLFRTREAFDSANAADCVARTYVQGLFIALFYHWRSDAARLP